MRPLRGALLLSSRTEGAARTAGNSAGAGVAARTPGSGLEEVVARSACTSLASLFGIVAARLFRRSDRRRLPSSSRRTVLSDPDPATAGGGSTGSTTGAAAGAGSTASGTVAGATDGTCVGPGAALTNAGGDSGRARKNQAIPAALASSSDPPRTTGHNGRRAGGSGRTSPGRPESAPWATRRASRSWSIWLMRLMCWSLSRS